MVKDGVRNRGGSSVDGRGSGFHRGSRRRFCRCAHTGKFEVDVCDVKVCLAAVVDGEVHGREFAVVAGAGHALSLAHDALAAAG